MAVKLTGIWHVFQQCFSIRSIYLIMNHFGNHVDIGHIHITFKFYEDILPNRVKMRSFKFALFVPQPLQTASVPVVSRASWPRFWPPEHDSCQVTTSCYCIGQYGYFDWRMGPVYCYTPIHGLKKEWSQSSEEGRRILDQVYSFIITLHHSRIKRAGKGKINRSNWN